MDPGEGCKTAMRIAASLLNPVLRGDRITIEREQRVIRRRRLLRAV